MLNTVLGPVATDVDVEEESSELTNPSVRM